MFRLHSQLVTGVVQQSSKCMYSAADLDNSMQTVIIGLLAPAEGEVRSNPSNLLATGLSYSINYYYYYACHRYKGQN